MFTLFQTHFGQSHEPFLHAFMEKLQDFSDFLTALKKEQDLKVEIAFYERQIWEEQQQGKQGDKQKMQKRRSLNTALQMSDYSPARKR